MIDSVLIVTFPAARNGRLEFLKSNRSCAGCERVLVCLNGGMSDKLSQSKESGGVSFKEWE